MPRSAHWAASRRAAGRAETAAGRVRLIADAYGLPDRAALVETIL
ncbi:hypothetical protein [Polymorphospora rubra]|nr:hypothetical protein [Polymorphospora rubra]